MFHDFTLHWCRLRANIYNNYCANLDSWEYKFTAGPIVHSPCFKLFVTFHNPIHLGLDGKHLFNVNPLVVKFVGFVVKAGIKLIRD